MRVLIINIFIYIGAVLLSTARDLSKDKGESWNDWLKKVNVLD